MNAAYLNLLQLQNGTPALVRSLVCYGFPSLYPDHWTKCWTEAVTFNWYTHTHTHTELIVMRQWWIRTQSQQSSTLFIWKTNKMFQSCSTSGVDQLKAGEQPYDPCRDLWTSEYLFFDASSPFLFCFHPFTRKRVLGGCRLAMLVNLEFNPSRISGWD